MSEFLDDKPTEAESVAKAKQALIDALAVQLDVPQNSRYDLISPVVALPEETGSEAPVNASGKDVAPSYDSAELNQDSHSGRYAAENWRSVKPAPLESGGLWEETRAPMAPLHDAGNAPDIAIPGVERTPIAIPHSNATDQDSTPPAPLLSADFEQPVVANTAPTGVVLDHNEISETAAGGTVVGTLSAIDRDHGDTHSFAIVGGDGRFIIENGKLVLAPNATLDFEHEPSINITVRVTDSAGHSYDQAVTIAVQDVNEAPTGLALDHNVISETAAGGTVVGTLSVIDPDHGDTHSFAIVGGNGRFIIDDGKLVLAPNAALDFDHEFLDRHYRAGHGRRGPQL